MKIIELLSKHIEDELEDACTYIRLALEYKETDSEAASLFFRLSQEEMTHMEALHQNVVSHIESYRRLKGEAPEGMKAIYDFLHRREIEKAEKVARLQTMFRK